MNKQVVVYNSLWRPKGLVLKGTVAGYMLFLLVTGLIGTMLHESSITDGFVPIGRPNQIILKLGENI
tara:strand:- start:4996 stop:5196 length:201 start_codon:yes stop_codon:yes gene_type:complete